MINMCTTKYFTQFILLVHFYFCFIPKGFQYKLIFVVFDGKELISTKTPDLSFLHVRLLAMMIRSLKLIQMCNINIRNIVTQNGNICRCIKSHYMSVNKISLYTG